MAFWGRVWSPTVGTSTCSSTAATACASSCYNITSIDQVTNGTAGLFDETPVSVVSITEAVGYWLDQLRKRTASRITVTNSSEIIFNITMSRGTRTDTMTWSLQNNQGKYPLSVTYATPSDSGSASFYNMGQALDWIVDRLA